MSPSTEVPSRQTLERFLRPRSLTTEEVVARYPAVVPLVARILGVVPRVFSYLEIWPPAQQSYSLVVPAFFDLPFCDLGLGIGSSRRSLVAYASSRGHGCMYCAAHSAVLGNVFLGARESLGRNAAAIQEGVCQLPDPSERALIDYGLAVGREGGEACTKEMAELERHFNARQIEKVVLVAATMGLLNRCLDTLGMVLEGPLLAMARARLAETGWEEALVFQEESDASLLANEAPPPPALSPWGLVRAMFGALSFASLHLSAFSPRLRRQKAKARAALGFCPTYLTKIKSSRARRTLLHLLIDRLVSSSGNLPAELRCCLCAEFARMNGHRVLEAHFTFLAVRSGTQRKVEGLLRGSRSEAVGGEGSSSLPDSLELACLRAAREASSAPVQLSDATIAQLTNFLNDQQIIEFVLTLSIASALLRIVRSYPQPLEPEVAEFVRASGPNAASV